ncbi:MAG: signal recognition particle subunit SRP19/SEC65 family protein [Candidatus Methanomethylophilaceae archaeon]|jgi:signal recognition particle subunit SRP19|nr:signal recognition particle subunit SRP19/SEC65 family protein [Candidatus Methanomethylophilaceae archaeon]NLF34119.1 signal recognition particle protein Srp19 [Thermoplasmatales archaeon]
MTYDDDTAIVLWPEYFDIERTRSQGRRVPRHLCVREPSLDIIAKGATILDLEYRVFEDKSYPANWAAKRGCVRVERDKMSKTEILPAIGEILVKNQGR